MRVAVAMVLVLALALGLGGCAPQGGEMEGEGISAAQGQREEGQDSAAAGGNIEEGGDSAAGEKGTEGGGQGLKVVATIFPPYDFARALTEGTGAQVTMLIKPGVESHSFDPTPEDILTIAEADLFLCIGGHDEACGHGAGGAGPGPGPGGQADRLRGDAAPGGARGTRP